VNDWHFESGSGIADAITAGPTGLADTTADTADVPVLPVGHGVAYTTAITAGGANLVTVAGGDDTTMNRIITTGSNGICETTAVSPDTQVIPVGEGKPDAIAVVAGSNGVLDSTRVPDDGLLVGPGRPAPDPAPNHPYTAMADLRNGGFDVWPLPGAAGQGNPDPFPAFNGHWITRWVDTSTTPHNTYYFDPSYGSALVVNTDPDAIVKAYEDVSLAGYVGPSAFLVGGAVVVPLRQNDTTPGSGREVTERNAD